jgi:quercetin dioxygenase-like cupin family protein
VDQGHRLPCALYAEDHEFFGDRESTDIPSPTDNHGEMATMEKTSLTALVRHELDQARAASCGRSARTAYGGHEHVLRRTLIALAAGQTLDEHENPGEATLHVLHGRVRLIAGQTSWDGTTGDLLIVAAARHRLDAVEDSAVLLTVAKLATASAAAV